MGDPEIHEDDMPIREFSALACFKLKGYDAFVEIDEDDLPLGVLWGLPGLQVKGVNKVDEDDLRLIYYWHYQNIKYNTIYMNKHIIHVGSNNQFSIDRKIKIMKIPQILNKKKGELSWKFHCKIAQNFGL